MRNDKRQAALDAIKTDPSVRVILISFKSGSTGLNLTCCNHVILMDLWWWVVPGLPLSAWFADNELCGASGTRREQLA